MKGIRLGFLLLLCTGSLQSSFAIECPAILKEPTGPDTLGEVRAKAIKGWDKLLTWAFLPKNRPYDLQQPLNQKAYKREGESLADFVLNYGYFSIYHPIVGMTTDLQQDIDIAQCLLHSIDRKSTRLNSSHIQKSRMPSSA